MTALNGQLAWAIHSWNGSQQGTLTTEQIESLTRHLTAEGYARPKSELGFADFTGLAAQARRTAQKLLKEFSDPADPAPQPADRKAQPA